jgi:hypothetical protein
MLTEVTSEKLWQSHTLDDASNTTTVNDTSLVSFPS